MKHEILQRLKLAWRIVTCNDGNLVAHAQRELAPSLKPSADVMDRAMALHLVGMVRLFSTEGHSGFSAAYATTQLARLLRYEPLGPLTGEELEWTALDYNSDMAAQNNRCGRVFRRKDGTAYDIEGVIFREPNGASFTSRASRVDITFPYTPRHVYADVPEDASEEQKAEAARLALSVPAGLN